MAGSDSRRPGERASSPEIPEQDEDFPSTIWLRVESAKDPETPQAREALGELCEAYWQPVYTFIRRKGHDPDQALDLTQGFFALLVEPGALGSRDAGERKVPVLPDGGVQPFPLESKSL